MSGTLALTALRTAATAVLTGLAALATVYPHLVWLPIIYAVLGAVGIHAVPSISQPAATGSTSRPPSATAPSPRMPQ